MDDISKYQKINNLARELMRHGQASSMDEAIRKAAQQVESGAADMFKTVSSTVSAESIPEMQESVVLPSHEGASNDDILRQLEQLIGTQQTAVSRMTGIVNTHSSQIQDMTLKMMSLISEITELKEELRKVKDNPVAPASVRPKDVRDGQTQFKPGAEIPSNSVRPKPDASGGHARSGNYKSEDVSIEKFFYFGNR